jgi:hypothetical protein
MKRLAAISATTIALLAIPATAMASTGGNPWTGNSGGPAPAGCPLPVGVSVSSSGSGQSSGQASGQSSGQASGPVTGGVHRVKHHGRCLWRHHPQAPVQVCDSGPATFNMPPSTGVFTENSGPDLYSGEQFAYNGTTYTVATVSGAVFTLDLNGSRYVNSAFSVVDGSATVTC